MLSNQSFINESAARERENNRTLNIIFLQPNYALLDPFKKVELSEEQIKSHPMVREAIPSNALNQFNPDDLAWCLSFSPNAVENLKNLCENNHAKIVILSSNDDVNPEQMKLLFKIHSLDKYVLDNITENSTYNPTQITKWLELNSRNINSFVILSPYDFGLSTHYSDRYIRVDKIFNGELAVRANTILKTNIQTSNQKNILDAIEGNSPQVAQVKFNRSDINNLKLIYNCNTEVLTHRIIMALANNQYITHLTLRDFCDGTKDNAAARQFLNNLANVLAVSPMKLEYLSIEHNGLSDLSPLLKVIDGKNLHIPHISFNANPIRPEDQIAIANWLSNYPRPIYIDLDTKGNDHGTYSVDGCLVNAVAKNSNIILNTNKTDISAINTSIHGPTYIKLVDEGRIQIEEKPPLLYRAIHHM